MKKTLGKNKLYKLSLLGLAFGAFSAPIALAAACDDSSSKANENNNSQIDISDKSVGKNWVFDNHRTVQFYEQNNTGKNEMIIDAFGYMTPNYGSYPLSSQTQQEMKASMSLPFIRRVRVQEDITKYDPVTKKISGIETSSVFRAPKYRFTAIKQLALIDESNHEYVFDKDYSASNDLLSGDPRDINSVNFFNTLTSTEVGKKIKDIRFDFRDDLSSHKWRQNLTGENGDAISADDFYLGLIHTILGISRDRLAYSNMSYVYGLPKTEPQPGNFQRAVDAISRDAKITSKPGAFDTPTLSTANGELVSYSAPSILGLNIEPLTDLSRKSEMVINNGKSLKLSFNAEADPFYKNKFWDLFANENSFTAIPYSKTLGLIQKYDDKLKSSLMSIDGGKLTQEQYDSFKNSLVYKTGYYHMPYGGINDFYTAGAYYLADNTIDLIKLKINDDYPDQRWNKQVNSSGQSVIVDTFYYRFALFANQTAKTSAFREGTSVTGDFSQLNSTEKQEANKSEEAYGVERNREFTASGALAFQDFMSLSVMPVFGGQITFTPRYFNNNFAKLMYGHTHQEMDDRTSTFKDNYIEYMATGDGFKFRKMMSALQNVYTVAREKTSNGAYSKGNFVDWVSMFAPEEGIVDQSGNSATLSNIFNEDQPQATLNTLQNNVLSKFVVKDSATGVSVSPIDRNSYISQYNEIGIDKYGPSTKVTDASLGKTPYAYIQAQMKALLDKVVGPLSAGVTTQSAVPANQLVIFEMPYGRGRVYVEEQDMLNSYKDMLAKLDPRLKVVAVMKPTSLDDSKAFKDATVETDRWPLNANWNVTHSSLDQTPTKNLVHYDDRTLSYIVDKSVGGYGWAAMPGTMRTEEEGIGFNLMYNFGYIQMGRFLLLSYYANPLNEPKYINDPYLAPLKKLLDFMKDDFSKYIAAATPELVGMSSSKKDEFITEFKKIRFDEVYKSSPQNMDDQDYIGFKGWEALLSKKLEIIAIDEKDRTADQKAMLQDIISLVEDYFNGWINTLIAPHVNTFLQKQPLEDQLKIIAAASIVLPESYRPYTQTIIDRSIYTLSLTKVWYFNLGTDTFQVRFNPLNRRFVDLDTSDKYFRGRLLFKNENGEFKDVQNGGIIF